MFTLWMGGVGDLSRTVLSFACAFSQWGFNLIVVSVDIVVLHAPRRRDSLYIHTNRASLMAVLYFLFRLGSWSLPTKVHYCESPIDGAT